jgi:hypothetical protein
MITDRVHVHRLSRTRATRLAPRLALASVLALAYVSGCASVPKAAPELDVAAKSFTPSEGKARIYVVRPKTTVGAAVTLQVSVDGRELGSTSRGTYLMTEVDPGEHIVSSKTLENSDEEKVTTEAGRSYFFVIKPRMGLLVARVRLEPVSEAEGRAEVGKAQRAAGT